MTDADETWLDRVAWNEDGLVPVIARAVDSGEVLNLAWMNREALRLTLEEGRAVYWSRSRGRLWRKGESSGHVQHVHEIRLDCDGDTLLLSVEQEGGIACHTGRRHCFFLRLDPDGRVWREAEPVLKDPDDIYGKE
jgi:phosphoribosyl-AMP cyclohydrolase